MIDIDIALARDGFALEAAIASKARALALFGPSGSGKTTLLHALAGLIAPERGRIALDGHVLFDRAAGIDLAPAARGLGVVFQDLRLFPHLSVRDNLLYGARHAGARSRVAERDAVIALLGLGTLLARRPDSLSGGEARRVAIGRALLAQPVALLLDEPLSGLHREARAEVLQYLAGLKRELRVPTLLVSHQADEVIALAEEVALIEDGRILATLPVAAFRARFAAVPG